jgi:hypothetical protein
MANPGRRRSLIWFPAFAGMSGLVVCLALAACTPKPKPGDAYAEAKKALQAKLGPTAEMHYVETAIARGQVTICGLAGRHDDGMADMRFVYADGRLTTADDVDAMAFEKLIVTKCPSFAQFKTHPPVRLQVAPKP